MPTRAGRKLLKLVSMVDEENRFMLFPMPLPKPFASDTRY